MRAAHWVIVVLALVLRLGFVLTRTPGEEGLRELPDQAEYLELGRNLVEGKGLWMTDRQFGGGPLYAFRTPGYPVFVAACGGSVTGVRVVQAVVDTGTVLAVMLIALRVCGSFAEVAAGVAGVLAAVCPWLVYFSGLVLTETVFTAMVVWGVWLLLTRRLFWVGVVVLGLSVLVRPGAMGLPVVLAVVASMCRGSLQRLPVGLVSAVVVGAVVLPWGYRNSRVLNEWVFTSTNAGVTRYDGFNPGADGSSDQSFLPHLRELRDMTETQRNHYLGELADEADSHRSGRESGLLVVRKAMRTWSPVPLSEENRGWGKWIAGGVYSLVAWGFAVAGIFRGKAVGGGAVKLLLLCPAIYFTVAACWSVGSLRYRVPAEPLLCVLAGMGAASAISIRREILIVPAEDEVLGGVTRNL